MKKTTRVRFEFCMKINVCNVYDKLSAKISNFIFIETADQDSETI